MKTHRSLYVLIAVFTLAWGTHAYAASARQDLVNAYVMVRLANNNYNGHRGAALKELERAGHNLGLDFNSRGSPRPPKMQSDAQMAQAGQILRSVRYRLDAHDRDLAAGYVDRAILEIDKALRVH